VEQLGGEIPLGRHKRAVEDFVRRQRIAGEIAPAVEKPSTLNAFFGFERARRNSVPPTAVISAADPKLVLQAGGVDDIGAVLIHGRSG
jgi:hypothetical protein